jgi:hypothetical protein
VVRDNIAAARAEIVALCEALKHKSPPIEGEWDYQRYRNDAFDDIIAEITRAGGTP